MKRQAIASFVCVLLLFGCTAHQQQKESWFIRCTDFAVSRPDHFEDCKKLQRELRAQGIRIEPAEIMLGEAIWSVDAKQFKRAKKLAEIIIARNSLTVAIEKDNRQTQILEEYANGHIVGETSYASEPEKPMPKQ